MLILSLVWGILAIIGMLIGFIPCLGSLNWLNVPWSGVGLVIGAIAVSSSKEENKNAGIVGIVLCGAALVLGVLRLILGGGVL
jgi:hypothetical protein